MSEDNETPETVGGLVKVRVTRSAVHDGKGGKFYQGAEVEVSEDVAEAWLANEWAELL